MNLAGKIVRSFGVHLIITMVLGVVSFVLVENKTISDLQSLLQAFFGTSVIWVVIIVWIDDLVRIYREERGDQ